MKLSTKKKTKKVSVTDKVKKVIDKKKKEIKTKKLKADIKKTFEKGVKTAKLSSAKTLDKLNKVSITAKEQAKVASKELSKVSKTAQTNAKKIIEIGKLKAQNVIIKNNINKSFEKVGMIVYKENINVDNIEIQQLINEITELKQQLKQISEVKVGK